MKRIVNTLRIISEMPSKLASLIFFLIAATLTFGVQYFVYRHLRRLIVSDFPAKSALYIKSAKWIFVVMNIPVVFLFVRGQIDLELTTLSQIMLYPYTIWQFLMMMWAVVLTPVTITRIVRTKFLSRINGSTAR